VRLATAGVAVTLFAVVHVGSPSRAAAQETDSYAVIAELDRMARRTLWPGFDPRSYPVAIFDGRETLLFRHPRPPAGFEAVPGRSDVRRFAGRHVAVTSNSSAEIGGVMTATVMPPRTANISTAQRAAVVAHEAFHVFQRANHPGWQANEVTLFLYPVSDPRALALRRQEGAALRHAVGATAPTEMRCWARTALDLRAERYALLSADDIAYERKNELNEGLAEYVEYAALDDVPLLPEAEFPPDEVRARSYATGAALAHLLDRTGVEWKAVLSRADTTSLDALLARSLAGSARQAPASDRTPSRQCTLGEAEVQALRSRAEQDVARLTASRDSARAAFLARPGWRLVVEAGREPLFPQGFDPLNVSLVTPREVLHTRMAKLGNSAGALEVVGRASLTLASGQHPLMTGVRTFTITGLQSDPVSGGAKAGGTATIVGEGIAGRFEGAVVERDGRTVKVRLR
jgi:hypothetical protein